MTHLRIIQNNGVTEEVSSSVILKLYELAISGDLDNTSVLLGRINATTTYQEYVDYLNGIDPITNQKRFPELYVTATRAYLRFLDTEVERVLLSNNIGDGVGITSADAASYSSRLGNLFSGNTTVTNINDLRYFTSIPSIGASFAKDATNLVSVNIPGNITKLSYITSNVNQHGAFRGCTKLVSVTLNEGLQLISNRCFLGCTSLTTINIPSTVLSIGSNDIFGRNVFYGCTLLLTVTGCSGVLHIGINAFLNCSTLTSINLSNIIDIGESGFKECSSLTSVDLSSCTTLRAQAFYGCTSLTNINSDLSLVTTLSYDKVFDNCPITGHIRLTQLTQSDSPENSFRLTKITSLTLGSAITSALGGLSDGGWSIPSSSNLIYLDYSHVRSIKINNSAWASGNTSLKLIKLPSTITQIGNNIVGNCTSLEAIVLPATTPPTYSGESWQTNTPFLKHGNTLPNANLKIYVPKASLNTYKTDANWGKYSDILLSIEDDYTDPDYYATTNAWRSS